VEHHWLCPALQFLPVPARASVVRHWPFGHARITGRGESVNSVLSVELLSITEMEFLFPGSEIWRERVLGVPKSLVAIRSR
jgi:hypothetical protein